MGARLVYGSFQLTGLRVCLLGCQVSLEGFALRHSHPTFNRKIPPFYSPRLRFVVFPIMPISDNILPTYVTFESFYTGSLPELHNTTLFIVVEQELQATIKAHHLFGSRS